MLLRRAFAGFSFVSFVLVAVVPGCDGSDEECEALRDEPSSGETTIRIVNERAEAIHFQGPGGCSAGVLADDETALGAILGSCEEMLDGELVIGDCEPDFLQIAAGDALEITWDRHVLRSVLVPEGCDDPTDDVDPQYCIKRFAVADGAHTIQIRYGLDFGDNDLSVEVEANLPADEIEIVIGP